MKILIKLYFSLKTINVKKMLEKTTEIQETQEIQETHENHSKENTKENK